MLAEWVAQCSADEPMLVVPWSDPETGMHFVDLRKDPFEIAEISEATRFPPLARALRALNATRSPFLTAKCDAWPLGGDETEADLQALRLEMDLDPHNMRVGFVSYIDLLWRERSIFASAHHQTDRLERIVRRVQRLPHEAALQLVLRPALLDRETPLEGFATTLYVTGVGFDDEISRARWAAALEDVVAVLRGRDFEVPKGSATIDLE